MQIKNTAIDLESEILGGIINDKQAILTVIDIIKNPRVFYHNNHVIIYTAILSMFNSNEHIDLMTIANKLKSQKQLDQIGGDLFLIELLNKRTSNAHIERHCRILQQLYVKRETIRFSHIIKERSEDDSEDIFEILNSFENFINDLNSELITNKSESIPEITKRIIDNAGKQTKGVNMPLSALNKQCNGWQNTDLIIVAARPGMGKSAYLNSICMEANEPVGVFSLEMSKEQLVKRMIAYKIDIINRKLQKNILSSYEIEKMKKQINVVNDMQIHIDDKAGISLTELKAKAKMMVRMNGVKLIIIDYLQLMTIKGKGNREQEISTISQGLKALAKELNIPIIALSQLSRAVETRSDKRPMLSDLRESGAIEQDADIIQFIYRPEYYGLTEWDGDNEIGSSCIGQAEIIQAKDRNGIIERFRCRFIADQQKFCDINKEFNQEFNLVENLENTF